MDAVALSRSLYDESFREKDLPAGVRAYMRLSREALLGWHRAGAGGAEIVCAYTTLVDHLLIRLFDLAARQFLPQSGGPQPVCTLVAQGGYGRCELNPHSDIDLLFLYPWKMNPFVQSVTERVLYTLWDAGLQVGHAVRTVSESIRLAGRDIKVKTSLLDARYLAGDRALFAEFEKAVHDYLVQRNGQRFIREKLEENRQRHERFGASVYLLEPDVKEGEGGLRDIHAALWIAKVRRNARDLRDLVDKGILSERELAELAEAQDFLWRVRNELHFSSGKHQDQLTFEEQEKIAPALGFEDEGKVRAVEAFMRAYYTHATQVSRLATLIINRTLDPSWGGKERWWTPGREIEPGLRLRKGSLSIRDPRFVAEHPGNLIAVFHIAQRHNAELDYRSRELVRGHSGMIDEKVRRSAAANLPFFAILKYNEKVYETLREMHACGVLGAFIPEFGRLFCMALHDLYHIYTVDQHSLKLVRELERLKAGEFKESFPLLTQLAREVEKIEILILGLLFHDIGKGLGGGHSEVGAQIARGIARRMRLNVDDTAQLEFLVRYHLLFASVAFRRDLEDEKTILDFAGVMGNINNLKMLYLLTYCDMRSVGPDVWNNWKASLLEELYVKTLQALEAQEKGELGVEDRRSRVRRLQARLRRRLLIHHPRERLEHFFESMPERYFISTPEEEIPGHFELMERFKDQTYLCRIRHFPELDCSKIAICTRDRPGLFASITGVFAALGMDILSARIATRADGLILDVFRLSHGGRPEVMMNERRWERLSELLEQVLSGKKDVAQLVRDSGQPSILRRRAPRVPTRVEIDNEASEDFTVVEVYTQDRIGVLFTIAYTLHQLGLSIHIAKISTNVDQVADIFYVTEEAGGKVKAPARREQILETLTRALTVENERAAQPAY
ncbi:MAG TPA: [protein-PII] uridylyltransferase [Candidatus Acidoferrales bacterium]|nr:[protein-PII] uridylyltransferase [Candidatus Acidoferrales bacterium]